MQTKCSYLIFVFFLFVQRVSFATEFYSIFPEEAFQKAKQQNKQILLFYTADWCLWCSRMEQEVYLNSGISSLISNSFIAVKIEEGSAIADAWLQIDSPKSIPYTSLLDKEGKLLRSKKGYVDHAQFTDILNSVVHYEESELAELEEHYLLGDMSPSMVLKMLNLRKEYGLEYVETGRSFLGESEVDILDDQVQQLFLLLNLSYNDPLTENMLSKLNSQSFETTAVLNSMILQITLSAYHASFLKKDMRLLNSFLDMNEVLIRHTFFQGNREDLIRFLQDNHRFELKHVPFSTLSVMSFS